MTQIDERPTIDAPPAPEPTRAGWRSRIDGGIHVPADDFAGRIRGERIGKDAWSRAQLLFGAGQAAD